MTQGWGPQSIRMVGLTLVIVAILFLVEIIATTHVSPDSASTAFGLLGAVAGYLFGRGEKYKD